MEAPLYLRDARHHMHAQAQTVLTDNYSITAMAALERQGKDKSQTPRIWAATSMISLYSKWTELIERHYGHYVRRMRAYYAHAYFLAVLRRLQHTVTANLCGAAYTPTLLASETFNVPAQVPSIHGYPPLQCKPSAQAGAA
jgi:hypothetical protein